MKSAGIQTILSELARCLGREAARERLRQRNCPSGEPKSLTDHVATADDIATKTKPDIGDNRDAG